MRRFFFSVNTIVLCTFLVTILVTGVQPVWALSAAETALKAADKRQWQTAFRTAEKSKDTTVSLLVEWFYLTQNDRVNRSFHEIDRFMDQTKDWPYRRAIQLLAEERMPTTLSPGEVVVWFENSEPVGASGVIRYAQALLKTNPVRGKEYIQTYWQTATISRDEQKRLFKIFKPLLTQKDHEKRLDFLIWERSFNAAQGLLSLVSKDYRALSEARIALARNRGSVDGLIARVPKRYQNHPGLIFERVRWRRQKNKDQGAIDLLQYQPDIVPFASLWWQERHILIRRALEDRQFKQAYLLAADHKQTDGFPLAQAEWIAGWTALNFDQKPLRAFQHFYRLYSNVKTPISKSRGAYWAGLASLKAGNQDIAKQWLATGARYTTTFYGQLAADQLYALDSRYPVYMMPTAQPASLAARMTFERQSLVEAFHWLAKTGLNREKELFFNALSQTLSSQAGFNLAANLALTYDDPVAALKVSKKAFQAGYMMFEPSYPVLEKKSFQFNASEELVHAIVRQESVFDPEARSSAGARGLMQLLPSTAKQLARQAGKRYRQSDLTKKPSYNVALGSTYIAQLLRKYDHHYPLAIAAYNAGPGRIDRVLRENGDPRKQEIAMVDWIEMIPIYETRNYVQRVIEAIPVYHHRLGHHKNNEPSVYASYLNGAIQK